MGGSDQARYPSLDGIRGIAIILVLLQNLQEGLPLDFVGGHLFGIVRQTGWIGVQLFFVLSGFLITDGLLQTQRAPRYFQSFFARRILRIFPLYYAALAFLLVFLPLIGAQPVRMAATAHNQVWYWLYLSNWAQPLGHGVDGLSHFWSLAVEEQFYLVWPFVIHRTRPGRLVWITLAIATSALVIRVAMRLAGADPDMVYQFTVCRMDALALGACIAALLRVEFARAWIAGRESRLFPVAAAILAITFLATRGYAVDDLSTQTIGDSALAIGFAIAILAAVRVDPRTPIQRLLRLPALRFMGKYSYGIYVIHLPLHAFLGAAIAAGLGLATLRAGALYYVLVLSAISIACAVASYHVLEQPFLRMKKRFPPEGRLAARDRVD
ncbi:MAG: acyltransferase [Steroidobacteraceae bacterium]